VLGAQRPFVAEGAPEGTVYTVVRDERFGGTRHYASFEELERAFAERELHPSDLKATVADAIISLLEPVRKAFLEDEEWQRVEKLAYADLNAKPIKKKKEKVYHPPPPGKGKNANKTSATDASTPATDSMVAAPPPGQDAEGSA
ncbi:hypothetical protein EW146_g9982, partial [Bondarzewia mesenterica]